MKRKRTVDQLVKDFHKIVENGPLHVCTCCNQMWYRESIQLVNRNLNIASGLKEMVFTGIVLLTKNERVTHVIMLLKVTNSLNVLQQI